MHDRLRGWIRLTLPGLLGAFAFALLSLTPSLLPRPALFQGLVTGVTAAIGYGLGVALAWVWRAFADREAGRPSRRQWRWTIGVGLVALGIVDVMSVRQQDRVRELMGMGDASAWRLITVPVVAVLVFALLVAAGRGLRRATRWVSALLARRIGAQAARATGVVLVAALTFFTLSGVVYDNAIAAVDSSFALGDQQVSSNLEAPTSTLRSGSPDSELAWEDLGRQGRRFVARGPSGEEIAEFTGRPALDPIRAYAGTANAEDVEERARLAVHDLERAGGFDRANLLVAGTTGSGFIEPSASNSFEYLTGGDSAIVSMQYSHLPSWVSFLVDQRAARHAGRALFDAVYERWSALPADNRPRLYLFGESLGSFALETAFSGEADLRNRTSGGLFVGPPGFNALFTEFREQRDPGSREIEPIFRDGRTVRFTNDPWGPTIPLTRPWDGPHLLYLVHPSDPITWWSPDLIWDKPDWLSEPRGSDVANAMRWYPIVTFWQTSADMAVGMAVPSGHGHDFVGEHVAAWASVLQPEGWTSADLRRLQQQIVDADAENAGVPPSLRD
ncbi:alpha/beta-hydrolase family protein [Aeromicrobium sp. Marseille-Q0843]|uniref:Alpha/beta-hydrolase family protein n=1 Tax=Aeromicrobium phoceense TaxID=2754045 RepID=A0A838XAH2_9ACTN|nr:alpha/beta-hydrolase family protein [Aeromicrobium phoceense]MBA4607555.1 alpha/beta-hydrolase family protein [Aeromicrobium phoceense]